MIDDSDSAGAGSDRNAVSTEVHENAPERNGAVQSPAQGGPKRVRDMPTPRGFFDDLGVASCTCEFCSGRKRWADNWCPRCGNVQLVPPKRWKNMDVCDPCEAQLEADRKAAP